jgi:hypothetical protein
MLKSVRFERFLVRLFHSPKSSLDTLSSEAQDSQSEEPLAGQD